MLGLIVVALAWIGGTDGNNNPEALRGEGLSVPSAHYVEWGLLRTASTEPGEVLDAVLSTPSPTPPVLPSVPSPEPPAGAGLGESEATPMGTEMAGTAALVRPGVDIKS
ncbi:hypothetical protein LCGC14_2983690, partial [marine sediment metagenome]